MNTGEQPARPNRADVPYLYHGLTKRELFAAMAMHGLVASVIPKPCAMQAVAYADAPLAELAKKGEKAE